MSFYFDTLSFLTLLTFLSNSYFLAFLTSLAFPTFLPCLSYIPSLTSIFPYIFPTFLSSLHSFFAFLTFLIYLLMNYLFFYCFRATVVVTCEICNERVSEKDMIIKSGKKVYHVNCFACGMCGKHLMKGSNYSK